MTTREIGVIDSYLTEIDGSDRLPAELVPAALGLAGEVGSILAVAKKLVRDRASYTSFNSDLIEEFGDTAWYLAALCRRANASLQEALSVHPDQCAIERDRALLELHKVTAALVENPRSASALCAFGNIFVYAVNAFGLDLGQVLNANSRKVAGAFLPLDLSSLPDFDKDFPEEERLPAEFRIHLVQRASGKTHMSMNGVFIGDPLLDNVAQEDGYRFHDVFHLANAAVLHWSPVIRALLKRKRKSDSEVDNTQDSGRAIVVEEGLAAWLFQRAGPLNYFEGAESVPYTILKTIQQFVAPYEVAACPPSAWECAILQGYAAFRQLREKRSGYLVGNRVARTLQYVGE